MPLIPTQILSLWLKGLLSLLILLAGPYLLYRWYRESQVRDAPPQPPALTQPATPEPGATPPALGPKHFRPDFGLNAETAMLLGGLALTFIALGGGRKLVLTFWRRGEDEPTFERTGERHRLRRPDGTDLFVETYGPADGTPVVLTHGWGATGVEWYYARKELSGRHRVIAWDLPGLGRSRPPENDDYAIEKMARDLDAVLEFAAPGGRPAVLLGHSIGGMILLTYCRLFPDALGRRVCGLVLAHTTYTNPLKTMRGAALYTAIQKPVIEPLAHLMIWLSPLVRLLNWLSYHNGTAHLSTKRSSFAGTETRGQLDWAASFTTRVKPAVLARGALGMLHWDASGVPPKVSVPVLIVSGDRDPTCKPEASDRLDADIPKSEQVRLSPAKHWGLVEHHGRFADAVKAFVDSNCARTTGG